MALPLPLAPAPSLPPLRQCCEKKRVSELASGHRPQDSSVDDRAKIDSLIQSDSIRSTKPSPAKLCVVVVAVVCAAVVVVVAVVTAASLQC